MSFMTKFKNYSSTMPSFIEDFLSPEGIITKKRTIDNKISENQSKIDTIQNQIKDYKSQNIDLIKKIDDYKETLNQLRVTEAAMNGQISVAKSKVDLLKRNLASEQTNIKQYDEELYEEQRRLEDLNDQIIDIQSELSSIEHRGSKCAEELGNINDEISKCNSSVSGTETKLKKKQEEQSHCQEKYERLTLNLVTSDNDIRNIKQNFIDTHSRDLMEFEERMYKITTHSAVLREKLTEATLLALQNKLQEDNNVTSRDGYNLTGDVDGYKITKNGKLIKSKMCYLMLLTIEEKPRLFKTKDLNY